MNYELNSTGETYATKKQQKTIISQNKKTTSREARDV
jgi:hypothetical protein